MLLIAIACHVHVQLRDRTWHATVYRANCINIYEVLYRSIFFPPVTSDWRILIIGFLFEHEKLILVVLSLLWIIFICYGWVSYDELSVELILGYTLAFGLHWLDEESIKKNHAKYNKINKSTQQVWLGNLQNTWVVFYHEAMLCPMCRVPLGDGCANAAQGFFLVLLWLLITIFSTFQSRNLY